MLAVSSAARELTPVAGYTQLPNNLIRFPQVAPELKDGPWRLYVTLLSYCYNGDTCYPSEARLAQDIGVTPRTIRNRLKVLEAEGYLTITRRGKRLPNLYTLLQREVTPSAKSDGKVGSLEKEELEEKNLGTEISNEPNQKTGETRVTPFSAHPQAQERSRPIPPPQMGLRIDQLSVLFHDQNHQGSNRTQVARLYYASELPVREFLDVMEQARETTWSRNNIKKAGDNGGRNRMPYYFAVLRSLTGLQDL